MGYLDAPKAGERWSRGEIDRVVSFIASGYNIEAVSAEMGRTIQSIQNALHAFGIKTEDIRSEAGVRIAVEWGDLLGIDRHVFLRLISQGAITHRRRPNRIYITRDSIIEFLGNQRYWMCWHAQDIAHAGYRQYALDLRQQADGYWRWSADVAHEAGKSRSWLVELCRKGYFITATKEIKNWWIWSTEAAAFIKQCKGASHAQR